MSIELGSMRGSDNGVFRISHKDWIKRFSHIDQWGEKASIARTQLQTPELRMSLIESANPLDQYRALELLSKFDNGDLNKENAEALVGDLFGDILLHHLRSTDAKRRNSFVEKRIFLDISKKSTLIGLKKLFKSMSEIPIPLDAETQAYLVNLLMSLEIDKINGLTQLIPDNIISRLQHELESREQRSRSNLATNGVRFKSVISVST